MYYQGLMCLAIVSVIYRGHLSISHRLLTVFVARSRNSHILARATHNPQSSFPDTFNDLYHILRQCFV